MIAAMSPAFLRRSARAVTGFAAAALALTLTACGAAAPADEPEGGAGEGYTVTHAMGETTLDAVPERVVVIDSPHLDALVSLGITPVGATESGAAAGLPPYLGDAIADVEIVGLTAEPDIDAIANLAPDLIIGAKVRHEAIYDELSAIAPTVFSENSGTDWREQARITAAAVDRTDEMEELLAGIDERAAEIGEAIGASELTASMVRFRPDNFRLYGPQTFSGSLLAQVGFDLGERNWDEYSMMELSPEQFEQIDGDVVFYANPGGDPSATTMGTVTELWGSLPGVASGRAFEVEDETWMIGIGVTGANIVLDQLEEHLS